MNKPLEALMPKRMNANWRDAILQECDCCNLYRSTVKTPDGTAICASCADGYYTDQLHHNLEIALAQIAELEASQLAVKLPEPLMPARHASGELFMTTDNIESGGYLNRDDVIRTLRNAGITVQGAE